MTTTLPPVLDVDAVATLLRCATTTVEERARRGDLPGLKIGEGWIFPAGALVKRLDELALDEAEQRRKPVKPSGVLQVLPGSKPKRKPPALHGLG